MKLFIFLGSKTLVDPDLKIVNIAFYAGFVNYSHFRTLSKKHTNLTPNEYRQFNNDV